MLPRNWITHVFFLSDFPCLKAELISFTATSAAVAVMGGDCVFLFEAQQLWLGPPATQVTSAKPQRIVCVQDELADDFFAVWWENTPEQACHKPNCQILFFLFFLLESVSQRSIIVA